MQAASGDHAGLCGTHALRKQSLPRQHAGRTRVCAAQKPSDPRGRVSAASRSGAAACTPRVQTLQSCMQSVCMRAGMRRYSMFSQWQGVGNCEPNPHPYPSASLLRRQALAA